MDGKEFVLCIKDESALDRTSVDALRNFITLYPYFQAAHYLLLKKLSKTDQNAYETELGYSALFSSDLKRLFYFLERDKYSWASLHQETEVQIKSQRQVKQDTISLIDTFLSTFGPKEALSQQDIEINYAPSDYAALLSDGPDGEQDNSVPMGGIDLINAFIENDKNRENRYFQMPLEKSEEDYPVEENEREGSQQVADDEFLTESLAKIYIKQRRYEKALEIIEKLSLKYPEKNIYFADQIRFLKKLIINTKL